MVVLTLALAVIAFLQRRTSERALTISNQAYVTMKDAEISHARVNPDNPAVGQFNFNRSLRDDAGLKDGGDTIRTNILAR